MQQFDYQYSVSGDPVGRRTVVCGTELVDGSEEAHKLYLVAEAAAEARHNATSAGDVAVPLPATITVYATGGKKLFTSQVHRFMKPVFVSRTMERCVAFRKPEE